MRPHEECGEKIRQNFNRQRRKVKAGITAYTEPQLWVYRKNVGTQWLS